jgi:hypothetical protein
VRVFQNVGQSRDRCGFSNDHSGVCIKCPEYLREHALKRHLTESAPPSSVGGAARW